MPGGTKHNETDLTKHGSNRRPRKADRTYQGNLRDDGHCGEVRPRTPDLETFLEGEVARGETSETKLTLDGVLYLKQRLVKEIGQSCLA